MLFLNAALLLLGQLAEHLAQMLAQRFVQHFPAAVRDHDNMILALPFRVA
jgi:hypothetical protein